MIDQETGEVKPDSIKNVSKKIALAMADMNTYAAKDGKNTFHQYQYTSIAQFIAHVRPALVSHGLVIVPKLLQRTDYDDHVTDVLMEYTIIDSDSGESISTVIEGRGKDADKNGNRLDKGPYKAYSGAFKYFLQEMFMIASGDDPDETDGNSGGKKTDPKPISQQKPPAKKPQSNGKGRPLDPDNVKAFLHKKTENDDGTEITTAQIGLVASKLEECFAPDDDASGKRLTVLHWLWEVESSQELTKAQAKATLDWLLKGEKDDTGDYPLHQDACEEAKRIYRQALKAAGQQEMVME